MERYLKNKLKNGTFQNVADKTSKTMSAIKGMNNKTTELCFRMMLARNGVKGWKMNYKSIVGKPDFFFEDRKLAVFIDGCYWHGCPTCGHIPKKHSEFWKAKIKRNQERDKRVTRENEDNGIKVIRFWEHELKSSENRKIVIKNVIKILSRRQ